jgi:hypothetical protein
MTPFNSSSLVVDDDRRATEGRSDLDTMEFVFDRYDVNVVVMVKSVVCGGKGG